MATSKDNIIWIDLEMTGLDPEKDSILEIACIITDRNLEIISDEFEVVIHQPTETLQSMSIWALYHHEESGLRKESQESSVSINRAEDMLLEFIKSKTPKGLCPLAGNTVYMDKLFLIKHMPRVAAHLHYRLIDVSSIQELVRRWYRGLRSPKHNQLHRALPDIKDSINQLLFYRRHVFKSNE